MISALSSIRWNTPRMIRRVNKNSKQVITIWMKNISDIKRMPPKHSFWEDHFVAVQINVGAVIDSTEVQITVLIAWLQQGRVVSNIHQSSKKGLPNQKPHFDIKFFHFVYLGMNILLYIDKSIPFNRLQSIKFEIETTLSACLVYQWIC